MSCKPKWSLYKGEECSTESDLFKNSIMEFNDIMGIPIHYYIRDESVEMDRLFGETTETKYLDAQESKMIYEPTEEPSMTDTFGIVSTEMIQYAYMPKGTWKRDISESEYLPKPGDVIKTLWNDRNYEIVDVSEEDRIFKLNKLVYAFILKPYRYSEQSDSAKEILESPDDTRTHPITAYGDNEFIQESSDDIDDYTDVDEAVYNID
jgi:hypothetical protein